MEWFKSLVEDNSGGASTMRVCVLLWMLVLCFNITYGTIKKQPFALSGELVGITACIVGAKAVQRFGEKSGELSVDASGGTTNGATNGSIPLTVTIQGSVPVQGTMPLQQMQPTAPVTPPTVVPVATPAPVAMPLAPGQVASP